MRGFLRALWMVLLLFTVAVVSALVTMRLAVHEREVEVPDVRGKTPGEAHRLAEDRGLLSQIERQFYSPTVPEGRVISQMPEGGAVVRRGWELRLALSLGPQRVTIPQVVGESQRAATITLQQRGLDSVIGKIELPGAIAGQVIGQDPPAKASDVEAPKVSLLVAQEVSSDYAMPGFIGRPLGSAMLAIKDAGFTLGKVTIGPAGTPAAIAPSELSPTGPPQGNSPATKLNQVVPAGTPSAASIIVSQEPAPGHKIAAGSEIHFVVR